MLTLTLFRHAKSSWETSGVEDRDRTLNARGIAAAPIMGAFLRKEDLKPDLVLCSGAVRTRQTVDLAFADWELKPKIKYEDALYLADPFDILARLRKTPRTIKHLMVVGHNPGLQILAIELVGDGDPDQIGALSAKLPTAGVVVITFDVKSWQDVGVGKGRLVRFVTPKGLMATAA